MKMKIEIHNEDLGHHYGSVDIDDSDSAKEIGKKVKAKLDSLFEMSRCMICGLPDYGDDAECTCE